MLPREPRECSVGEAHSRSLASTAELAADDPLRLFLGPGRALRIRCPGGSVDTISGNGTDSILIVLEAGTPRPECIGALLGECASMLRNRGRIAVLMPNRIQRSITRGMAYLRALGGRTAGADSPTGAGASTRERVAGLGEVVRALRSNGFRNIEVHAADGAPGIPDEIRPRSWRDDWSAAAWLLTARGPDSEIPTVLASIVEAAAGASLPAGGTPAAHGWSRTRNSSRGKSLILAGSAERSMIIHVPRGSVARADMANAHRLLHELQEIPAIARRVPRPLGHGTIGEQPWYAESRLVGAPLASLLSKNAKPAARHGWLRETEAFLYALNSQLEGQAALPVTEGQTGADMRAMLDRLSMHLPDDGLRRATRSLFDHWTQGACSRIGLVHGDFGAGNLFVAGGTITGVIDWEAARVAGPPVLDASNYLDSVARCCSMSLTIVDTIPMLACGEWPDEVELAFLRRFFEHCGIDFRFLRAFALLYFLFHVGPQMRFATSETGPIHRSEQVLRRLLERA